MTGARRRSLAACPADLPLRSIPPAAPRRAPPAHKPRAATVRVGNRQPNGLTAPGAHSAPDLHPGKHPISGTTPGFNRPLSRKTPCFRDNPGEKLTFIPEKAPNTGRRLPSNKGSDRKKYVFLADPDPELFPGNLLFPDQPQGRAVFFKQLEINTFLCLGYHF